MPTYPPCSVSYVIRVWDAGSQPDGTAQLRFLVERVGEPALRRGFESFAALVAYLHTELGDQDALDRSPVERAY